MMLPTFNMRYQLRNTPRLALLYNLNPGFSLQTVAVISVSPAGRKGRTMRWKRDHSFPRIGRAVKHLCRVVLSLLWRQGAHTQIDVLRNVKDGHFAVIAWDYNGPAKNFVKLKFLRHPAFLSLLEAAEQEFGLNQKGVLVIPCKVSELWYILQEDEHIRARECYLIDNRGTRQTTPYDWKVIVDS